MTLLLLFIGLLLLSVSTHGMKARDKYVIGKYLRTLEERFDAKHSVRNKQSSTAQETQNVLNEARRNFFLRERNWEQRGFGNFNSLGWLKDSCNNGCWWCCYVYKVITDQKPNKVKKLGKSSSD